MLCPELAAGVRKATKGGAGVRVSNLVRCHPQHAFQLSAWPYGAGRKRSRDSSDGECVRR